MMDDAPWMPPASPADQPDRAGAGDLTAPVPAVAAHPAPSLPSPVPAPPGDPSAWARGGDESSIAPIPAPPVLPAAAPAAVAGPFAAPPAFAQAPPAAGEPIEPTSGGGRSGRSKLLVGSAVVAVLAAGAAGVFAVRGMSDSAEGGAATPDELGVALMTAVENEDALGAADVLLPGERDLLRQPMIDLVAELARLEVLSPEADLGKIDGFDIVFENESVAVESTNVADIANLTMTADATITVDGSVVPVGDLVTDNMDPSDVDEMRSSTETTDESFDLEMTAVELDGRWYFSLFYTLAESVRGDMDAADIPLEGIGAVGADSPEGAVDQLFASVEGLDLRLMMQTLNPGEAGALQRYAPLFLGDAEEALAEVPLEWTISTREFRVEGDGDQRTVFIDAIAIDGNLDGEEFSVAVKGDCVSAEFQGETFEQCTEDATASPELDDLLAEAPAVKEFLETLSEAFADVEPMGLELRQYDGAWYVSPVSTFSEAVLKVLRALDRDEIDRLVELGESAADEGFDAALGGIGGFGDDDFAIEDEFVIDEMTSEDMTFEDMTFEDMTFEDMTSDGFTADESAESFEPAPWEACYGETEVAAAASCFQSFIDSGELEPYVVPIELRFPECGYDERWSGELYQLSDADFMAAVEESQPCFLALLEHGEVDEFDLPSEILHLECFEGRNWFSVFDDAEYDERYYACIAAANA